jgi:hypothetical protein
MSGRLDHVGQLLHEARRATLTRLPLRRAPLTGARLFLW